MFVMHLFLLVMNNIINIMTYFNLDILQIITLYRIYSRLTYLITTMISAVSYFYLIFPFFFIYFAIDIERFKSILHMERLPIAINLFQNYKCNRQINGANVLKYMTSCTSFLNHSYYSSSSI